MSRKAEDFARERNLMVKKVGTENPKILESMRVIPRHWFVGPQYQADAYLDIPLPIGFGQTTSQPTVVAIMIDSAAVKETDKVLEIGSGCGYPAAVLSRLCKEVITVEIERELAAIAKTNLRAAGCNNVQVMVGNGNLGVPEYAPYDAILVTATVDEPPKLLLQQLAIGGRMIVPVRLKGSYADSLMRIKKKAEGMFTQEHLEEVRFVPMVDGK